MTIPFTLLENQIKRDFGILLDCSIENCSTLSEQAAWIDFRIEHNKAIDFLSDWITIAYDSRTDATVKKKKINLLPAKARTTLWGVILQSKYHLVTIEDIQLSQLQVSHLVSATIKVTGYLPSNSSLAITETFELGFVLEMTDRQRPKIVSFQSPES
ncbi:MAG: hypothetical protein CLLPBCKN_007209 [Chroococcidiopsis cubana SAG 39.79]|uniref:Uncharacterized protein n=2 Tax=Chroococcidiopsis TaxID=54298 RepID=A0AB37URU5_9CYAN|nr:hypothetical protein [Chroococcidiopsis cubana SAG 39.79]PSB60149.1 hypothetical protein C7B79_26825 [Chroococcidiopsis cubana CCALA 043]RUT14055.1 hypothetical protein DSM107010_05380 [Chroococcidiopsis cubana SAG 39.79]